MRQRIVDWFAHRLISIAKLIVELVLPWMSQTIQARWIGRFRWAELVLNSGVLLTFAILLYLSIMVDAKIIFPVMAAAFCVQFISLIVLKIARFLLAARRSVRLDDAAARGMSSVDLARSFPARRSEPLTVECEFVRAAATLLTRLHPLMSLHHAKTMRADLERRLEGFQADEALRVFPAAPDFGGSRGRPDHRHFFAYVPEREAGERLPLLLALHGHGGNALIWLASWKPLADRLGLIVVSPSFGYGQWEHHDATACLIGTVAAVRERYPVNDRLVVAGISLGGCGVTRAALVLQPDGLIYISPTLEPQLLQSPVVPWIPILVFQGKRDVNVRSSSVEKGIEALKTAGFDVEYHGYAEEDHYLRFRSQRLVDEAIAAWWETKKVS